MTPLTTDPEDAGAKTTDMIPKKALSPSQVSGTWLFPALTADILGQVISPSVVSFSFYRIACLVELINFKRHEFHPMLNLSHTWHHQETIGSASDSPEAYAWYTNSNSNSHSFLAMHCLQKRRGSRSIICTKAILRSSFHLKMRS